MWLLIAAKSGEGLSRWSGRDGISVGLLNLLQSIAKASAQHARHVDEHGWQIIYIISRFAQYTREDLVNNRSLIGRHLPSVED